MDIQKIIKKEIKYQQQQLKLIPSENYVNPEVMQAVGSVFMNKYAEGYSNKRYYAGNINVDEIELTCKERALKLFNLNTDEWHANVQAVTGSIANLAVYNSILSLGDRILSMSLTDGGHLSHGWKLSNGKKVTFTSKIYESHFYHVSPDTYLLDYDEIEKQARKIKPKLIISGGTAYPRTIDYQRLGQIAHNINAYYLADVAHEAGLIAAGVHDSPFPHADFVTMTTRKTLRGPIGAIIIAKKEFADVLDRSVFPGLLGGPMINSIAGIAIALKQADTAEFSQYSRQVILNAKKLAEELIEQDFNVITQGTDKHLILIDVRNKQPDGLTTALLLESADIIANKNTIAFDNTGTPWRPSGLRLGTPAVTTRGMREQEMKAIAELINMTIESIHFKPNTKTNEIRTILNESKQLLEIKDKVHKLTQKFPVYTELTQ
ncbi:MAG: serine hydroxymethyltransferase [Patescibacteria group bacterium]|nr:serine hydroxymethyltransferase [Patescibacteria group bacterium]